MKIKLIGYIGIFVVLAIIYCLIWIFAELFSANIYKVEFLKKDIVLSIGMGLISTIGFYLKIRLAQKNKLKNQKSP